MLESLDIQEISAAKTGARYALVPSNQLQTGGDLAENTNTECHSARNGYKMPREMKGMTFHNLAVPLQKVIPLLRLCSLKKPQKSSTQPEEAGYIINFNTYFLNEH
jgi:hypothetical protein